MIYETAQTGEDIRRLLRHKYPEPVVISAPRQSGKTTELLKYAEETYPNGKFAIVCLDRNWQEAIIRRHWEIFNRISQADIVAKRLLGEPLGAVDINPPLMLNPGNLDLIRGRWLPVFCDEWSMFPEQTQQEILFKISSPFLAAVTS